MAPEILLQDGKTYGAKSDIFSLGLAVVHVLLGTPDFVVRTNDKRRDENGGLFTDPIGLKKKLEKLALTAEMIDLVLNMVATDPDDRLSAEEVYSHPALEAVPDVLGTPERHSGRHKSPEQPQEEAQEEAQNQLQIAYLQKQLEIERARADDAEKKLKTLQSQTTTLEKARSIEAGLEELSILDDATDNTDDTQLRAMRMLLVNNDPFNYNTILNLAASTNPPFVQSFIKELQESSALGAKRFGSLLSFATCISYDWKRHFNKAAEDGKWPSLHDFMKDFPSSRSPITDALKKTAAVGKHYHGAKSSQYDQDLELKPNGQEMKRKMLWVEEAKKVSAEISAKMMPNIVNDKNFSSVFGLTLLSKSTTFNPLLRNAVCLSLSSTIWYSKAWVSSKISGSGKKLILVPVFFTADPFFGSFVFGFPNLNS